MEDSSTSAGLASTGLSEISSVINRFDGGECTLWVNEVYSSSTPEDDNEPALFRPALVAEVHTQSASRLLKLLTEKMNLRTYEVRVLTYFLLLLNACWFSNKLLSQHSYPSNISSSPLSLNPFSLDGAP